jgi:hypothetical protein
MRLMWDRSNIAQNNTEKQLAIEENIEEANGHFMKPFSNRRDLLNYLLQAHLVYYYILM